MMRSKKRQTDHSLTFDIFWIIVLSSFLLSAYTYVRSGPVIDSVNVFNHVYVYIYIYLQFGRSGRKMSPLFHPRVVAVAPKRSRSFCQKCWWHFIATHMHPLYVALNNTVNWCMVARCAQNLCEDGISFKWHQPCNNQNSSVSTPL